MAPFTVSLALRHALCCALPLGGLFLADCVVTGQATVPARQGTLTVQGNTATVSSPTYVGSAQTAPQPVMGYNPGYGTPSPVVGTPVMGGGGAYLGVPVSNNWVTTGYAEADYITYNMSLRARQFAAGFYPVTQLFRAQMYQGAHEMVTVTATSGRCYRVVGVGGPGVQDLDLRLRDMNGNVLDQDVATDNFPVLGLQRPLCLPYSGTFQIEIIMYAGGGQVGVQAFAQ